ncbi:sucrose-6-phosphate hydrolase [Phthorimaea operculella]|nr:sucrose-6-phosphate hydrolase [Phthorimaea operculella]
MADTLSKVCLFSLVIYFATAEVNNRYYPRYHLAPPKGWMNDPNGFCVYQDEYHLFYQHNPDSSTNSTIVHWGHAKSSDLFNWEHLPIAMYPDEDYDQSGVFSGSALVENEKMYIMYTGHRLDPGSTTSYTERQALATSDDGVNVVKYENNPVIQAEEHQPDIRDPKLWKHEDTYYVILGNSFNNHTTGRVLLYSSKDLKSWEQVSVLLESDGSLGYMWECPDFFELQGHYVLLFSPQGIPAQGDKYQTLFQTGYIVGDFDYESNLFTPITEFKELDHGHDFYASQSTIDKSGKRVFVAWFDMWEQQYPEQADGFNGFMTIPRELTLTEDLRMLQNPVSQIASARGKELRSGYGEKGATAVLEDKAGEVTITAARDRDLEVILEGDSGQSVTLSYNYLKGTVTLDRGGEDPTRRTKWRPRGELRWRIYVDASSVELFCGDGEVTFSSRFFPEGPIKVRLGDQCETNEFSVNEMIRTVPDPS